MRADFVHGTTYGSGHINDTYCVSFDQAGLLRLRYIFQRINTRVFKTPVELMENISRVTRHSLQRLQEEGNPESWRRTLTCIPAIDGKAYAVDPQGGYWRVYPFIERATGHDELETNEQAFQAAKAFGNFQKLAAGLGGKRLHETIPDFHNTPKRLEALREAIEADICNRAAGVKQEIAFALSREADCRRVTDLIASGGIPERVTHNDTKLNNVLLDDVTAEGVCVIDLDTTMPGSALYDFGDMVRTAATNKKEDDTNISSLAVRLDRFEALVQGYMAAGESFLNPNEIGNLAFSGKLLTLECGIRFLTDYLKGDVYFKIKRNDHNMDRCRNQFAFVAAMEKEMREMERIVAAQAGIGVNQMAVA
ncbi:MAG: aminoglycoside phosphotransferase family protein [Luteolibacter sp.]|uniref:phosphotransferase enzyme family protein n=1 Tax=Luteolibacter sp. TaxID=1962973 RepID=UPI003264B094